MKRIILILIAGLIGTTMAKSQVSDVGTELNELTTPNNPAFNLLGLSPSQISRPTLMQPFAVNLANIIGPGGSIASDIAIEAAPFWWFNHPNLTYEKYTGVDGHEFGVLNTIAQSASFSLATADASPGIDSVDSRNLAIGFRTELLKGQPSKQMLKAYSERLYTGLIRSVVGKLIRDKSFSNLAELKKETSLQIENFASTNHELNSAEEKETAKKRLEDYFKRTLYVQITADYSKADIVSELEKIKSGLNEEILSMLNEISGLSRVGWLLEMAGAYSGFLPDSRINYVLSQDWAGWATLTYRTDPEPERAFHDFIAMGRFSGDAQVPETYNVDFGVSWVVSKDRFSLSLESILRQYRSNLKITATDGEVYNVTETDNTYRLALAFQYRLHDNINLTATLGKDYDNALQTGGNIFSLLNAIFTMPTKQQLVLE